MRETFFVLSVISMHLVCGHAYAGVQELPRFPGIARFFHTAALDTRRQEVVVHGGTIRVGGEVRRTGEIWAYDLVGNRWRGPLWHGPEVASPGLAYDAVRDRVLTYGGSRSDCRDEMWEWRQAEGTATLVGSSSTVGAAGREHSSLVIDPIGDRAWIAFGNCGVTTPDLDYFAFDLEGNTFEAHAVAPSGFERAGHVAAWIPKENMMLVYGGVASIALARRDPLLAGSGVPWPDSVLRSVAAFDPSTDSWDLLPATAGDPSRRTWSVAGYDPYRNDLVVYGGEGAGSDHDGVSSELRIFNVADRSWAVNSSIGPEWRRTQAAGTYCPCLGAMFVTGGLTESGPGSGFEFVKSETFLVEVERPAFVEWSLEIASGDSVLVGLVTIVDGDEAGSIEGTTVSFWDCGAARFLNAARVNQALGNGQWVVRLHDPGSTVIDAWQRRQLVLVGRQPKAEREFLARHARPRSERAVNRCSGTLDPDVEVLHDPRPLPFRSSVVLAYRMHSEKKVQAEVIGTDGRRIRSLWSGQATAGIHQVSWDGRDEHGRQVAPGVFFLRVATDMGCQNSRVLFLP